MGEAPRRQVEVPSGWGRFCSGWATGAFFQKGGNESSLVCCSYARRTQAVVVGGGVAVSFVSPGFNRATVLSI